jgi:hypothetical protein
MFIPDPDFFPSRIPEPGVKKELLTEALENQQSLLWRKITTICY